MRTLALGGRTAVLPPLAALVAVSAFVRARGLGESLWIDEGISAGIASHGLGELPGLLRLDGSPPLYYALLHGWIEVAGSGDAALRVPSLVFALLTVPAALWLGRSLFGARAGWLCAVLAALSPFLTRYAAEARMYALVGLLSTLATGVFLHAYVQRRRRHAALFAALLTVLLYTHYWALFFALGAAAAFAVLLAGAEPGARRRLAADGALGLLVPSALFAPWAPTLAFQVEHTGAPWSNPPPPAALAGALALAAAAAVLPLLGRGEGERRALRATAVLAAAALGSAWAATSIEPGWASRYLVVLAGPFLLLAAAALARAGAPGLAVAAGVLLLWAADGRPAAKSNVEEASARLAAALGPGDLVVSTQPEQVPVLAHYLPPGVRYATPLGIVSDPRVMDWRRALDRLERARADDVVAPLLARLAPGATVALVQPAVGDAARWRAPWTRAVLAHAARWEAFLRAHPSLAPLGGGPAPSEATRAGVVVALFRKTV
ncbi:MAG TPA: glycosyltransferase family 39 protein [Gaiellaceae bacterium]|nr:glycosyltransferase family 39 protein [Gaiellaceae bacterium]